MKRLSALRGCLPLRWQRRQVLLRSFIFGCGMQFRRLISLLNGPTVRRRRDDSDTSAFANNRFLKKQRFFQVCSLTLLAATITGCALPHYVTSLDKILEQEGRDSRVRYGYRCTTGAHRGASTKHTENTMAALKAADENDKYAFIEFDVQYSKDKKIVVYHDKFWRQEYHVR